MNERTAMDSLLESMLEDRAAGAAPSDLRREVIAAAMAEIPAGPRRSRLGGGRTSTSPLRLLAIAAVLGTAAAGALVAGGALRDDRRPPDPATVLVPVASPGPTEGDVPGAPTRIRCTGLPADGYADRETLQIPPYPFPATNSDIVYLASPATGLELTRLAIPDAGSGAMPIRSGTLRAPASLGVSPDGRWITLDAVGGEGTGCGDPVLVSVIDGSMLRPFAVGGAEAVGRPAWSADGRTLYAVHRTLATGPLVPAADRGSVWAWDRVANTVDDLGAPCDGCGLRALFPRAIGDDVVATYTDADTDACGHLVGPPCSWAWGIALHEQAGWRVLMTPKQLGAAVGTMEVVPLGVASDGTFAVLAGDSIALVAMDGSGAPELIERPCCYGLGSVSLSPDGSTIAGVLTSSDGLDSSVALLDIAARAWSNGGTISHRTSPLAESGGPLASAWAPDGKAIAFLMTGPGGDATFLRIVRPGDGTIDDLPLERAAGDVLTWLPSTP